MERSGTGAHPNSTATVSAGHQTPLDPGENFVVIATVAVGLNPFGVAYDSATNEVFATNTWSNTVSVVCDGTASCGSPDDLPNVVATVAVGTLPDGLAYDSATNEVFVANDGSGTVSVICDGYVTNSQNPGYCGPPDKVVTTVVIHGEVSTGPIGATYDSTTNEVFVTNGNANNVSVICDGYVTNSQNPDYCGPPDKVVATVGTGGFPYGAAYDPAKDEVFVVNDATDNVSVICDGTASCGSTNDQPEVVATVPVGLAPVAAAYDPAMHEIFVTNSAPPYIGDDVSVICDGTASCGSSDDQPEVVATVPVGTKPMGAAYDPLTNEVFVSNVASRDVSVICDGTASCGSSNDQPEVEATVAVEAGPVGVAYDPTMNEIFVANVGSNTVSVIFASPIPTYTVTLTESGLLAATTWSVTLNGNNQLTAGASISFDEPDGTYSLSITPPPYYAFLSASPYPGEVTVNGGDVTETILFTFQFQPTMATPVGTNPQGVVFDPPGGSASIPSDGYIYVANAGSGSDSLTVLDATTDDLVYTVPLGGFDGTNDLSPVALTVDSYGDVWVAGMSSVGPDVAGVVEVTGLSMVPNSAFSISGFDYVTSIAVTVSDLYVEGSESGTTGVVSGVAYCALWQCTTSGDVYMVTLNAGAPGGLAVDDSDHVWAAQTSSSSSAGDLTGLSTSQSIPLPALSLAANMTYDPSNGNLYVGGICSGVTVSPYTCKPGDAGIDVVNIALASEVAQIDSGTGVTPSSTATGIAGIAYDPWASYIDAAYSDGVSSSGLLVIDDASNGIAGVVPLTGLPTGVVATASPVPESVFVALDPPASGSLLLISHTYPVVFSESGLPSGQTFEVTLDGVTKSLTTDGGMDALTFLQADNSVTDTPDYAYTITAVAGWSMTGGYSGTVTVNGEGQIVARTFTQVTYTVTFTESKIPASTLAKYGWTVVLNGAVKHSTVATVGFTLPNGTYVALITGPSGHRMAGGGGGLVAGSTQSVTVSGATTTLTPLFLKGPTFTLAFSEKGLPTGQSWCVEVDAYEQCTAKSSVSYLNLTPGSRFTYAVVSPLVGQEITASVGKTAYPLSGVLTLTKTETMGLTFAYPSPVTFTEVGLPSGANWCVKLGKNTECSFGASIVFNLQNGTYGFKVTAAGYSLTPMSGKVVVRGAAVRVGLSAYTVTFHEYNLPSGTSWCVKFGTNTECSTSGSIVFTYGNGTYAYSIGAVSGYTVYPSKGTVTVAGSWMSVTVAYFFANHGSVPAVVTGGLYGTGKVGAVGASDPLDVALLGTTVLGLLGAAWTVVRTRREA